jgi:NADH-quinone oxidoreductase subunit J
MVLFYITAAIMSVSALMVVTRQNTMHALLYLIVTMLAIAVLFYLLGAPMAAALEVIVYAGAIMVLVVFVIMMLNQGDAAVEQERQWMALSTWWGPALLSALLLIQLLGAMFAPVESGQMAVVVSAKEVGIALYGPYLLVVELASILLLTGVIGAFHVARSLKVREKTQW